MIDNERRAHVRVRIVVLNEHQSSIQCLTCAYRVQMLNHSILQFSRGCHDHRWVCVARSQEIGGTKSQ